MKEELCEEFHVSNVSLVFLKLLLQLDSFLTKNMLCNIAGHCLISYPWDPIHKLLPILSPLATDTSSTGSSQTCKLVKQVTPVTVCSSSHLSCRSSFPSQRVQYRTSWYVGICEVCALQMMNDILWEGKHIAPHIFKASAIVHTRLYRRTLSVVQNASIWQVITFVPALNCWFVVFCPWYWASTPDYNLDYVIRVAHHANSQSDLQSWSS